MTTKTRSRRSVLKSGKLSFQRLEKREMLAAQISELLVDPFLTQPDVGQYVEIRGEANEQFANGTYFVAVSDRGIGTVNPGVVHAIFDLSGQTVGSNGFLVILPQASPFQINLGANLTGLAPTVLQSNLPGFGGLPGGIYQDVNASFDYLDPVLGSTSYFLIQSDVAPALFDDIDANDNGVIEDDSLFQAWNVLDSVSLHHGVFSGDVAYGQIVLVEQLSIGFNAVLGQPGAEIINGPGHGYAARVGNSTGHSANDWVFGTVRDFGTAPATDFRFEDGIFGIPVPPAFQGRRLDHLGDSNFAGGIRGRVADEAVDPNGNLISQPLPGISFLADTNSNGIQDTLINRIDPDLFTVGTELTNAFPGVTLTTVIDDQNGPSGFKISPVEKFFGSPFRDNVLSHSGVGFFNSFRRLRLDFYEPVSAVSVDFLGAQSAFSSTYGFLEAFDASGQSLGAMRTRALFGASSQRIRIGFESNQIAYAVAYGDDTFLNSSPFGRIERASFEQQEFIATTDENGEFAFPQLVPDIYEVVPLDASLVALADDLATNTVVIDRYENFVFDYQVRVNSAPELEPQTITIAESIESETPFATIVASDVDAGQLLRFSIENSQSIFMIDPLGGELSLRAGETIDFESQQSLQVVVTVTDSRGAATDLPYVIDVSDVNEPPIVSVGSFAVSEEADIGSAIGRVDAFDPELPTSPLTFAIVGGTGAAAFSIDELAGILRVVDRDLLDFEVAGELTLLIAVSDSSDPPVVTQVEATVVISDANDTPTIPPQSFLVNEDAGVGSVVGVLVVVDPDVGQTQSLRILEGATDLFSIESPSGRIILLGPLNFELRTSYELVVQAFDDGNPTRGTSETIVINVGDVDEPASLAVDRFTVLEDTAPGTVIGSLVATDPESAIGFSYSSGDESNPASLFDGLVTVDSATGRLTIAAGVSLNVDGVSNQLTDELFIVDAQQSVSVLTITLTITNVNEAPTILTNQIAYPQGLPAGRAFAVIEVADPEGDEVNIEVSGTGAELFSVDAGGLISLRATAVIDFDATPQIDVTIVATDPAGLATTRTISVVEGPLPRFGEPLFDRTVTTGTAVTIALPPAFLAQSVRSVSLATADGTLPAGLRFDAVIGRLTGTPLPRSSGVFEILVNVLQQDGVAEVEKQEVFTLTIDQSTQPLVNQTNPLDVDVDGDVDLSDVLKILNFVGRTGGGDAFDLLDTADLFYDANRNNSVNTRDALTIINFIARRSRAGQGEGETNASYSADQRKRERQDQAIDELASEAVLF